MYSDPNEPLLQSVTPPPSSPFLGRARWLWSKLAFALDRRACALLRVLGLRDVDAREARSLLLVTFGVAGLTLGLYFGIPRLHPSAPRAVASAARAAEKPLPPSRQPAPAATTPAPTPPALAAIARSNMPSPEADLAIDDDVSSAVIAGRARWDDGALEAPTPKAKRGKASKSAKATKARSRAKARALAKARVASKARALAKRRATASSSPAVAKWKKKPSGSRSSAKSAKRSKAREWVEVAQR